MYTWPLKNLILDIHYILNTSIIYTPIPLYLYYFNISVKQFLKLVSAMSTKLGELNKIPSR